MNTRLCSLLVFALCARLAVAGEFNPKKNISDPSPVWSKLPAADGKSYSLDDFKESSVVVVAFTCNSCPYAVDYEDRLIELANDYKDAKEKVAVVAINVNLIDEDNLEAMSKRAKEKGYLFPYLFDESQKIAQEFGASRTPEMFVLNKDRKIVYMGAFDDNTNPNEVSKEYVRDAIHATLMGHPVAVAETAPVGCSIRFLTERQRLRLLQKSAR